MPTRRYETTCRVSERVGRLILKYSSLFKMEKNLFDDLRNLKINLGYSPIDVGYLIHEDLMEKVILLKNESADRYRKSIIEKYAKENEIVRNCIERKTTFLEIGEPIINRAMQVYEDARKLAKNYFDKQDIMNNPECLDSVKRFREIVDLNDFFASSRIPGKVHRMVLENIVSSKRSQRLLPAILWGTLGTLGSFGTYSLPPESGFVQSSLTNLAMGLLGFSAGLMIPLSFSLFERTPENRIKRPAERLKKDLIWTDDCFKRIYGKK